MKAVLLALCMLGYAQGRMVGLHSRSAETADERRLSSPVYCDTPTAKAKVEFPESLGGRITTDDFDSYSGYVNVTEQDWLFYWFFEAASSAPADAPLIIWTNGGPGCTAMEGATTEIGPWVLYRIKESSELSTGQLSDNGYAWNQFGPLLVVDQPRYVGNSFGYGPKVRSSVEAGEDIVTFINGWYSLFPEYQNRKVIIAGESYGGHYLPAWANAIMDFNEATPDQPIPLSGIAIGNGCVNDTVQDTSTLVEFQHLNNLIPANRNPRNQVTANRVMQKHLGYTPNFYDFRLVDVQCPACYSFNYTKWSYWFLQDDVIDALHVCGEAGVDAFAGTAGGCIDVAGFDANDTFDYSGALARALEADISVLFYYGKDDLACNYVGGFDTASTIPWSGQADFQATEMQAFGTSDGKAAAGQIQQFGPLTWVQIEGAGHMVPLDQPDAAAAALRILVDQVES